MIDSKEPLFKKTKLPSKNDPSIVIHHSEEHNILYWKEDKRKIVDIDKNLDTSKTNTLSFTEELKNFNDKNKESQNDYIPKVINKNR